MILLWMWRYHSLTVFEEESVEEAVRTAYHTEQNGDGVLHGIEIVDEGWVSKKEITRIFDQLDQEEREHYNAVPDPAALIRIRTIDEHWATVRSCETVEQAEFVAEEWQQRLGAERVKVQKI